MTMGKLRNIDVARLASAVARLATASSEKYGRDCLLHASIGKALLEKLGVDAKVVIGFAAWRVGDGDGDVVLHVPAEGMKYDSTQIPFHAWLEVNGSVFDLTTYQLKDKARMLDAQDGGNTQVDWCPEYLITSYQEADNLDAVIQDDMGEAFYVPVPRLEEFVLGRCPEEADEGDVSIAWMLYQNPGCQVIGCNTITKLAA
jgi:hypothetical protein